MKHLPFATVPDRPAFPLDPGMSEADPNNGLTKREYFAAQAMAGMLGSAAVAVADYDTTAQHAVKHADALVEALNLATLRTQQLIDRDDNENDNDDPRPLE